MSKKKLGLGPTHAHKAHQGSVFCCLPLKIALLCDCSLEQKYLNTQQGFLIWKTIQICQNSFKNGQFENLNLLKAFKLALQIGYLGFNIL